MKLQVINTTDFPYTMPKELYGGQIITIPNDGRSYTIPWFDYKANRIVGIKILKEKDDNDEVIYTIPEMIEIDLDNNTNVNTFDNNVEKNDKSVEEKKEAVKTILSEEKKMNDDLKNIKLKKGSSKLNSKVGNKVKEPNLMKDLKDKNKEMQTLKDSFGG